MNDIATKEKIKKENMICQVRWEQVLLDYEVFVIKYYREDVNYE